MVKFTSISSIIMLFREFYLTKKNKIHFIFIRFFLILAIERLSICNLHFKYILTYNC